jgi:subtilisin family serine protease
MGDLVWRTGAHQIWRQGLTGKGVKVAVIDQGVAEHPELDGAVDARVNLTAQRGAASVGDHGTHVAGIIHALAPDARINSYAVFPGGVFGQANRKLMENPEPAIIKAVHQAVADGNQVINMSLSSGEGPSGPLAKVVEEYAARGVIFMVSAGNARNYAGGVGSPSSAGSVVSVGSTEWSGHMSDFTSFGERFDARTLQTVVKDVFLFPGGDIVSTMPQMPFSFGDKEPRYASMSGTSMAAPGLSGVVALMVQDLAAAPVKLNPLATADRIRTALRMGSEHMSLDRLPLGVPLDQPFLVVHPTRAVEALRREDSVAERTGM